MSTQGAGVVIRSFAADFEQLCRTEAHRRVVLDAKTGRVWTYDAFAELVLSFRRRLAGAGVRAGERIFSILPNSLEQFAACLAAMISGIDFCPISPLSSMDEARRFVSLGHSTTGLVPPTIDRVVSQALQDACRRHALIPVAMRGVVEPSSIEAAPIESPSSGKLILFTSGTTASPKAIVLDGDRLWSSAIAWAGWHAVLTPEARFYNMLPMSYLGGLFNLGLIPLACRGSVVITDAFSGISALRFWPEVEEQGVTVLWLAPTIVRSLLALHRPGGMSRTPWAGVRLAFLGMAPSTLDDKARFESAFGIPLLENYALSETTFLTSEALGVAGRREAGSVGPALPWVTLRTRAPEPHAAAEVEVQTPFLFDGYLGANGEVRRDLTPDGFFRTGDLGEVRRGDNVLVLKGRSKDIVKKGGYLLVLRDLEELAERHAGVEEAVAVGMPHPFYGETAVLCVRLAEGIPARPTLEALRGTLMEALAKFKWPTEIVAVASFPKTESGKIQRQRLASVLTDRQGIVDAVGVSG